MPIKKTPLPDAELLRQLLDYDPETGKLYWKERPPELCAEGNRGRAAIAKTWNAKFAGKEAFTTRNKKTGHGYFVSRIYNVRYTAHRVIWKLVTGDEPDEIDHENGDGFDNRWENLREGSHFDNMQNMALPSNNTSGVIGVSWRSDRKCWGVRIEARGRVTHLGHFDTIEEAAAARKAAEQKYGFHANHGRKKPP